MDYDFHKHVCGDMFSVSNAQRELRTAFKYATAVVSVQPPSTLEQAMYMLEVFNQSLLLHTPHRHDEQAADRAYAAQSQIQVRCMCQDKLVKYACLVMKGTDRMYMYVVFSNGTSAEYTIRVADSQTVAPTAAAASESDFSVGEASSESAISRPSEEDTTTTSDVHNSSTVAPASASRSSPDTTTPAVVKVFYTPEHVATCLASASIIVENLTESLLLT